MNKQKLFGLSDETIAKLRKLLGTHPVISEARIYGSRAKGNFQPGSDIDIVLIAPEMQLDELFKIANELDDLLLPYKIDLSLLHHIDNAELLEHIQRVGQKFYP